MPSGALNPALRYVRGVAGAVCDEDVPDRDLLARLAADRDEAAFAALVRRHGPMVLGVCLRILRQREDAEDAFQATFLALSRRAAALRPRESVGGWLHSVAYRAAQKARVAAARRRKHEALAPTRAGPDPAAELSLREAGEALDEELVRLPDRFRVPLVLCYLEGLTRDEAAERLGWPVSTLKSRLAEARERLGRRLSARGLGLPAVLVASLFSAGTAAAVVPAALLDATLNTVGSPAAGVSVRVAAITEGVVGMSATKLKIVTAALLGVAALGVGVGLCGQEPGGGGKKDAPPAPTANAPERPRPGSWPDLTKVDRTIATEPAYKTKNPKYCLLLFGAEAKTRVWLVQDGDALYVDLNGNGDLTEDGERVGATDDLVRLEAEGKVELDPDGKRENQIISLRVQFKVGTITERDGKARYTLWVGHVEKSDTHFICAEVNGKYLQQTYEQLRFGDRPKDAPVVHLNGPLAVRPWPDPPLTLRRGDEPTELIVKLGTPGAGERATAWLSPYKGLPADAHPTAEVEFPNKEPGGKPVKVRLPLTKRLPGDNLFMAPLPVPEGAGGGKAKVTVQFSDWKDGRVVPASFEVPVEAPKPSDK
jgi:RNA polymerase sigma factor (sigma-70 family)